MRTDGKTPDARSLVTLRGNVLALNANFVRSNKLDSCSRVTVHCDASKCRIGLRFHSDLSDPDSFALTADGGGRGGGRAVQISAVLAKNDWLRAAAKLSTRSRRYPPIWNSVDGLWVINIRPSFENSVSRPDQIESGIHGIYRYLEGDTVVYIGCGNIRARAKIAARAHWAIDKIEYSVIPEKLEQEKWEDLWLED